MQQNPGLIRRQIFICEQVFVCTDGFLLFGEPPEAKNNTSYTQRNKANSHCR
jgi:hypothetical protein